MNECLFKHQNNVKSSLLCKKKYLFKWSEYNKLHH